MARKMAPVRYVFFFIRAYSKKRISLTFEKLYIEDKEKYVYRITKENPRKKLDLSVTAALKLSSTRYDARYPVERHIQVVTS